MKRYFEFITRLVKKCIKDEIGPNSGELTYRLILCVFPLLIFVMTILGFLNLDISILSEQINYSMPSQVVDLFVIFDAEILSQRRVSLMSTSLVFSIFNASSGFLGIIRGINKSYNHSETRGFIRLRLVSIGLVLVFTIAIIVCILTIIFQEGFVNYITAKFKLPEYIGGMFGFLSTMLILALLTATVMLIYKYSNCVKQSFRSVLPGALLSVAIWVVVSKCFNIYIGNFAKFSVIYGSIGSVMILLIWLNLMSLIILIGSEINALIHKQYGNRG